MYSLDLKLLADEGAIKRHATHDVAVIRIAVLGVTLTNGLSEMSMLGGVNVLSPKEQTCTSFDIEDAGTLFDNVLDGSDSYILGYPVELLNTGFPIEVDFNFPLIRKGVISQRNRNTRKIILDSGVYGGNSGGPVLMVQHRSLAVTSYRVVGLVTQFVPVSTRMFPQVGITNSVYVNSGYSVVEPIDYALELMNQF